MRQLLFARSPRLLCVLLFIGFSHAQTGHASPQSHKPATSLTLAQKEGIDIDGDGSYSLRIDAAPPPLAAISSTNNSFQRYGFFLSAPLSIASPAQNFQVRYDAEVPADSGLRIDVRVSNDGQRWSSWEIGVSDGAVIAFQQTARVVQYRATLLGSSRQSPTLRSVEVLPTAGSASYHTMSQQAQAAAPTYRVHATRMGMVGGRTANGHIIRPRDHYVSLPSWRSLCSKGGREYLVRITYNGKSSVAPVWDVGPWNVHDNYWDEERERFRDLRRGWPQDHAAYFDGYNGRRAEKGYVRFPTAVDIGDGVWWDDLGIRGDRAVVDITFLWLGDDPAAATPEATATTSPTPEATSVPTTTATIEPTSATPESTVEPTTPAPAETTVTATESPVSSPSAEPTSEVTAEPTASEPPAEATEAPAQPTPEATSEPTATTEPTYEPLPTASAAPPTVTPEASETPAATSTPQATESPAATEIVTVTAQPEPRGAVTATPITATATVTPTIEPTLQPTTSPTGEGDERARAMSHYFNPPIAIYRREEIALAA